MAQKWEYTAVTTNIRDSKGKKVYSRAVQRFRQKKSKDGKTTWDNIINLGEEGWELVSVTPITGNNADWSYTTYLVYTFKRPIEE